MDEEQKEKNIPAPVQPENNQNIAPAKGWQLKSWHVVLVGMVAQLLVTIFFINAFISSPDSDGRGDVGLGVVLFFIPLIAVILSGGILTSLLCSDSEKTRKLGAIVSIISGPLFFISLRTIFHFGPIPIAALPSLFIFFPAGIFFFLAGIYYFWKKV